MFSDEARCAVRCGISTVDFPSRVRSMDRPFYCRVWPELRVSLSLVSLRKEEEEEEEGTVVTQCQSFFFFLVAKKKKVFFFLFFLTFTFFPWYKWIFSLLCVNIPLMCVCVCVCKEKGRRCWSIFFSLSLSFFFFLFFLTCDTREHFFYFSHHLC